jgi:hypothetical protein
MIKIPLPLYMPEGAAAAADAGAAPPPPGGAQGADKVVGAEGDKAAPAADKGAAKPAARNALDDAGPEKEIAAPVNWPDNWREMVGAEKGDKQLARFKSPADIWKSYTEAQARISKGLQPLAKPEGEDATEESVKAWRKEMGVPDDAAGYQIPDSVKSLLTDADKPAITHFMEAAHAKDWPAKYAAEALEWYTDWSATIEGEMIGRDKTAKEATIEELRKEWGGEYKANQSALQSFAKEIMGDVPWASARLPVDPALGDLSGQMLGNVPAFMKNLLNAAVMVRGDVTFVDGNSANKTMDRIAELKEKMKTDEFSQAERAELVQLTERAQKAGKAAA